VRIVGGKFAGRTLTSPQDFRVRPTAELVRAGMLDMLAGDLKDARVLDLFAGTGALGLEAISRGAKSADFVEFRPDSLHALRANVATLRLLRSTRIFKRDAIPFAAGLGDASYDIVFADPPYGSRQLDLIVESWQATRFSRILAVEHARTHELPKGAARRVFDETVVTIYRLPAPAPPPTPAS
jgi:16S rRNA (guanine966-N2)-methyltransferase